MNVQPIFTAAKVMSAIYKIASTAVLLGFLYKTTRAGHLPYQADRRRSHFED